VNEAVLERLSDIETTRRPAAAAEESDFGPNPAAQCLADGVGFPVRVGSATWPLLVSSGLFAMAHYNHGPDPIPLFFLAVGLGYLYQRTHRVLPCIVVHFLVNATTMMRLWQLVSERVS
jgi:hypothetical protein